MAHRKSKTVATWLALVGGSLGWHRFYLYGARAPLTWLHALPTVAGLYGAVRAVHIGQDDKLAWLLIPLLGMMLAQAALFAILYGLTPDDRWNLRHNPHAPPVATGWGAVLGVIAALMIGATALMSTIAFSGQRFFEWQLERAQEARQR